MTTTIEPPVIPDVERCDLVEDRIVARRDGTVIGIVLADDDRTSIEWAQAVRVDVSDLARILLTLASKTGPAQGAQASPAQSHQSPAGSPLAQNLPSKSALVTVPGSPHTSLPKGPLPNPRGVTPGAAPRISPMLVAKTASPSHLKARPPVEKRPLDATVDGVPIIGRVVGIAHRHGYALEEIAAAVYEPERSWEGRVGTTCHLRGSIMVIVADDTSEVIALSSREEAVRVEMAQARVDKTDGPAGPTSSSGSEEPHPK